MAFHWWELAPANEPSPSKPIGLDWRGVDNLSQVQAIEPRFVPYAERLRASVQKVVEDKKEDDNDAWGWVKDNVGGELKRAMGWTSDRVADYNSRFVTPMAAWIYGGIRGGVEAPNPIAAYAGSKKDIDKAEEVMSKLHPAARLALEFVSDPLFWGTLPLTVGGSALMKATQAARYAVTAERATGALRGATAAEKALSYVYDVAELGTKIGHIPDKIMGAALGLTGRGMKGAANIIPVLTKETTAEGIRTGVGWLGMKGGAATVGGMGEYLGKLSKGALLALTPGDTADTLKALSAVYETSNRTVGDMMTDLVGGKLDPTVMKALTPRRLDIISDIQRLAPTMKLDDWLARTNKLGLGQQYGQTTLDAFSELGGKLAGARRTLWNVPAEMARGEIAKLAQGPKSLYHNVMATWIFGVLCSPWYAVQNRFTDAALAGTRALLSVKKPLLFAAMDPASVDEARAIFSRKSAEYLPSEIKYGEGVMETLTDRLGVGVANAEAAGLMPSTALRDPISKFAAAVTHLTQTEAGEKGIIAALKRGVLRPLAKGAERAITWPMRQALDADSTAWLGSKFSKQLDLYWDMAARVPEMANFEVGLRQIMKTPEFTSLAPDVRELLVHGARFSKTPSEFAAKMGQVLNMPGELAKLSVISDSIPGGPMWLDMFNDALGKAAGVAPKARLSIFNDMVRSQMPEVAATAALGNIDQRLAFAESAIRSRFTGETADRLVKTMTDHFGAHTQRVQTWKAGVLAGDYTATDTMREMSYLFRHGDWWNQEDVYLFRTLTDESLDAAGVEGKLFKTLNRPESRAAAAEAEDFHQATKRLSKIMDKGNVDEIAAEWIAYGETYRCAADIGFLDGTNLKGSKDALWDAYAKTRDAIWRGGNTAKWRALGVSEADLLAVAPVMDVQRGLQSGIESLWRGQTNVLAHMEATGDQAWESAKRITQAMTGFTAEGAKERAIGLTDISTKATDFAHAVMGSFYAGKTNFDEVANIAFPFARWTIRAPALSLAYMGRNPWFVPMSGRYLSETDKEQLPLFGAWLPTISLPFVGNILADPLKPLAPYQMIRPILAGPEVFGRGGAQEALSALGVAGLYPGPLPQAVIGHLTGQSLQATGEMFPMQRGVTQPLQELGETLSATMTKAGLPAQITQMAKTLGVPENMLTQLAGIVYGDVSQDVLARDIQRSLVDMGYDPAEVDEKDDAYRAAARVTVLRRALQFAVPVTRPISNEQLAYNEKRVKAIADLGISQAEQIAMRKKGDNPWALLNSEEKEKVIKSMGEEEFNRRRKIAPIGLTEKEARDWWTIQTARALQETTYDQRNADLRELGIQHQAGEITGLEYREKASEIKQTNYLAREGMRKQALASLYGADYVSKLDEAGLQEAWVQLSDKTRQLSNYEGEPVILPEDEWLDAYQEIRPELYLQPDGEIDWIAYRDAQAGLLQMAGPYADYIQRWEDRQVEDLPSEKDYREALQEFDVYNRIPKHIGFTPEMEERVEGVEKYAATLRALWQQANPQAALKGKTLPSEQIAAILVTKKTVPGQDATLWLMSTKSRFQNPQRKAYALSHPRLTHYGLVGAGTYLSMPLTA